MILSIMCHVSPSVEPTILVFKPGSTTPRFQTGLTPLDNVFEISAQANISKQSEFASHE